MKLERLQGAISMLSDDGLCCSCDLLVLLGPILVAAETPREHAVTFRITLMPV